MRRKRGLLAASIILVCVLLVLAVVLSLRPPALRLLPLKTTAGKEVVQAVNLLPAQPAQPDLILYTASVARELKENEKAPADRDLAKAPRIREQIEGLFEGQPWIRRLLERDEKMRKLFEQMDSEACVGIYPRQGEKSRFAMIVNVGTARVFGLKAALLSGLAPAVKTEKLSFEGVAYFKADPPGIFITQLGEYAILASDEELCRSAIKRCRNLGDAGVTLVKDFLALYDETASAERLLFARGVKAFEKRGVSAVALSWPQIGKPDMRFAYALLNDAWNAGPAKPGGKSMTAALPKDTVFYVAAREPSRILAAHFSKPGEPAFKARLAAYLADKQYAQMDGAFIEKLLEGPVAIGVHNLPLKEAKQVLPAMTLALASSGPADIGRLLEKALDSSTKAGFGKFTDDVAGVKLAGFSSAESPYSPTLAHSDGILMVSTDRDAARAAARTAAGLLPSLSDNAEVAGLSADVVAYLGGEPLGRVAAEWLERIAQGMSASMAETVRKEIIPLATLWLSRGQGFVTISYSEKMAKGKMVVK